ncbi:MAG: hypothetical protein LBE91_08450 [Tannerella sp.]|jgi:hypothetical protein|nr:hypothetical protein [Tannerella sp.]
MDSYKLNPETPQLVGVKKENGKAVTQLSRKPNYFLNVNSKYESLLNNQIGVDKDDTVKRRVINECIKRVEGITYDDYLITMRDSITKFVYFLPFLLECKKLGLNPFEAAQNIIVLNKATKVTKRGIFHTFKGNFKPLEGVIFTESELANAKFDSVEGSANETQITQLSDLITKAMAILPDNQVI